MRPCASSSGVWAHPRGHTTAAPAKRKTSSRRDCWLKARQPDGPFVLSGFSFGALCALRAAERLAPQVLLLVGVPTDRDEPEGVVPEGHACRVDSGRRGRVQLRRARPRDRRRARLDVSGRPRGGSLLHRAPGRVRERGGRCALAMALRDDDFRRGERDSSKGGVGRGGPRDGTSRSGLAGNRRQEVCSRQPGARLRHVEEGRPAARTERNDRPRSAASSASSRNSPCRRSFTTRASHRRRRRSSRGTCPRSASSRPSKKSPGPKASLPGTHGVVAEKGRRWGIVFPHDARGLDWDGARILSQACLRAGLPEESWKAASPPRLLRFTAEVF